jgi:hypothetical protein
MSFDKQYPNRKDKRKPYRGSKRFDRTCRNHGACPYCETNRLHNTEKRKSIADASMEEFVNKDMPSSDTIPERDFWPDINLDVDVDEDESQD